MENRKFTRVGLFKHASLSYGGQVFSGVVRNASLRGLFFNTEHDIPLDVPVEISVKRLSQSAAHFDARVIRKERDGIALLINRMDIGTLVYMRDQLAEKCGNVEAISHETKMMIGHMLSS